MGGLQFFFKRLKVWKKLQGCLYGFTRREEKRRDALFFFYFKFDNFYKL